jgi:hypothetical protein
MKIENFEDCQKMEELLSGKIDAYQIADAYGISSPEENELLQRLAGATSQSERRDLFVSANCESRAELLIFKSLVDNATTQDERWKLYTDTAVSAEQQSIVLVEIIKHGKTLEEHWYALGKVADTIVDEPNPFERLVLNGILAKVETQEDRMRLWESVNSESDIAKSVLVDIMNNAESESQLWELYDDTGTPFGICQHIIRTICNRYPEN